MTDSTGQSRCACGKPVLPRKGSVTCGAPECKAANHRWHKLKWWHANRGPKRDKPIVNLSGPLPEMDYSGTAPRLDIPEVDTSGMRDARKSNRVRM